MGHIFINIYHNQKTICSISIYFLNMYVKNCNSKFHQWYQNKMMSNPNLQQPLDKCTSQLILQPFTMLLKTWTTPYFKFFFCFFIHYLLCHVAFLFLLSCNFFHFSLAKQSLTFKVSSLFLSSSFISFASLSVVL